MEYRAVLIAGPTASGKSGLATEIARHAGGVVINADSMQVYDAIPILTARPTEDEMAGVPHLLFGHVAPNDAYSVARWLVDAAGAIGDAEAEGRMPVLVGGTGLYFKALVEGLSPVPEIDPEIRDCLRTTARKDPAKIFRDLSKADPEAATLLDDTDLQRAVRALEVIRSTGRPLSWWQARDRGKPVIVGGECAKYMLSPPRDELRHRIAARFEAMIETGAASEVEQLFALDLSPSLPVMRAIGVRELGAMIAGEISKEAAIERAVAASRQYAKRQLTWFRNQFDESWLQMASARAALRHFIERPHPG